MDPLVYDDLLRLVKRVLLLALKPDVVIRCTSITALKKLDLNERASFLKAKEIKLGSGARECIKNLKNFDLLSSQNLQVYMNMSV